MDWIKRMWNEPLIVRNGEAVYWTAFVMVFSLVTNLGGWFWLAAAVPLLATIVLIVRWMINEK